MSQSKAKAIKSNSELREQLFAERFKLIRLLTYVVNAQRDYPELEWEPLPDTYDEMTWRYAA